MSSISADASVFTAINIFTVAPQQQDRLVTHLEEFITTYVRPLPGFLSATVHRSEDGKRVLNYAQWRSRADWEQMERDPAVAVAMREQYQIAPHADFHIYSVAAVIFPAPMP